MPRDKWELVDRPILLRQQTLDQNVRTGRHSPCRNERVIIPSPSLAGSSGKIEVRSVSCASRQTCYLQCRRPCGANKPINFKLTLLQSLCKLQRGLGKIFGPPLRPDRAREVPPFWEGPAGAARQPTVPPSCLLSLSREVEAEALGSLCRLRRLFTLLTVEGKAGLS